MMDELELLKKDWQNKEEQLPKLSYNEIYTMIWKKSSSIVKWIFYISIVELVFWIVLNTAPFLIDSYQNNINQLEIGYTKTFVIITSIITYGVILVFIFYLWKSYKAISAADNVKSLMERILRTRKIINYYVAYNIIIMFLATIYALINAFTNDDKIVKILDAVKEDGSELKLWLVMIGITLLGLAVTVGFIWLFYRLIYGFLLRKLNRNYRELKKLEI
ncbi:hypothetical protein [Maribacter sp. 2308TA10-17]|uniref:hypothetical protein n=1 Tax=Maribacter sp. 2308TA10-17 TaxID=3386276 RepID=UPI0039BD6BD1